MKWPSKRLERSLIKRGFERIAGVDEVGKGAWAGPLVAAAVILPIRHNIKGIADSKQLSPAKREKLYRAITKKAAAWSVAFVHHRIIDRIGIQKANHRAFVQAVKALPHMPDYIVSDAIEVRYKNIPASGYVRGDERIHCIAAASIVAKVSRDRLMVGYHKKFPQYCFHKHKGYGTALHHRLLKRHGLSAIHRQSFSPMKGIRKTAKMK